MSIPGDWTLHFNWGNTDPFLETDITLNGDGSVSGPGDGDGDWYERDGRILLSFDNGPAKYGGSVHGKLASGAMSTFAGFTGIWYMTRRGVSGLPAVDDGPVDVGGNAWAATSMCANVCDDAGRTLYEALSEQVGSDATPAAPSISGNWMLHFSWGATTAYAQTILTFDGDGRFTGPLTGRWHQQDGTLLLAFDAGPAKYAGTVDGSVGSGAMTTFTGFSGAWYLTKQGTFGVARSLNAMRPESIDASGIVRDGTTFRAPKTRHRSKAGAPRQ